MKRGQSPPEWSTRFLRWFLKPAYYEDIQGDLEEEFESIRSEKSNTKAAKWYNWQIIRLFIPSMMKKPDPVQPVENSTTMFRNYLKIGIRSSWKYRTGTLINLTGLSIGIASFILIALFVIDELSYDRHHEKADDIFRVTTVTYDLSGNLDGKWGFCSGGIAPLLKEEMPQVTHAVRMMPWVFPDLEVGDKKFPSSQVIFASPEIFDVFTIPFIAGDQESAFKELTSVVISEKAAIKFYGADWRNQDIIGKRITASVGEISLPVTITGVYENMPSQSHFQFDYISPFDIYVNAGEEEEANRILGNFNFATYVLTNPGTTAAELNAQSDAFFDKYGSFHADRRPSDIFKFNFQPLLDVHLNSGEFAGAFQPGGSKSQVYIFGVVGILLLVIACINYMNIATSRYTRRLKEIGVRKVVGATKVSLISQFLTESLIITFLSFPIALLLVYSGLPFLNEFVGKELSLSFWTNFKELGVLFALVIFVGLLAGLYPAIYLGKIKSLDSLKGEALTTHQKLNFRSVLVVFQYVVAIGLIFSLMVVGSQIQYILNKDMGFDRDQVLHIWLSRTAQEKSDLFKERLQSHSNIKSVTMCSRVPTGHLSDNWGARFFKTDSATDVEFRLPVVSIDEDYFKTFGIELIAGEGLRSDMKSAFDSTGYYVINRMASEKLGFDDPNEIVGRKMQYGPTEGLIYGVVEDFNFESVHNPIEPIIFVNGPIVVRRASLKMDVGDVQETLSFIENIWEEIDPVNAIDYQFLDERYEQQYVKEERLSELFKVFTGIAIVIGCLGMLGMVSFIVERKTKEIGIRKVLGASFSQLLWLVSKHFALLVGVAALIALPVGFWFMKDWLEQFAYSFGFNIWMFLVPLLAVSLITAITIGYQSIRATLINPVECLKDE